MVRDLPLGNGHFLVDFDLAYNLSDVYFDHAGQANHAAGKVSIFGAWVADGGLSWLGEGWEIERRYRPQAQVTDVQAHNPALNLGLEINDAVPAEPNALVRRVTVHNLLPEEREVRLFWHLDMDIVAKPHADTAIYDPETKSVLIYKGDVWLLLSGYSEGQPLGLAQYTVGNKGSFTDAYDGWLEGQPVASVGVDAVGGITSLVPGQGSHAVYFWLAAGRRLEEAVAAHQQVVASEPGPLIEETAERSRAWLRRTQVDYQGLPERLEQLYERSLLMISSALDRDGAAIASPDSSVVRFNGDTYQYAWPRDGALAVHAFDVAGHPDESHALLEFYGSALKRRQPWLWQKYNPDGSRGSTSLPMFNPRLHEPQLHAEEDETALMLWALAQHAHYCPDPAGCVARRYADWGHHTADWLAAYRREDGLPRPSSDLWGERYGIWSFTAGAVVGALAGAAEMAQQFGTREEEARYREAALATRQAIERVLYSQDLGRFITGLRLAAGGEQPLTHVDASLYGLWAFGAFAPDDPRIESTMQAIERELWLQTEVGGIGRQPGDRYQRRDPELPGNPWIVTTLWLAQWHAARGHRARALELLHWAAGRALPSGVLPEQADPHTGEPVSVSPLTWSHTTYVLAVHQHLGADRVRSLAQVAASQPYST